MDWIHPDLNTTFINICDDSIYLPYRPDIIPNWALIALILAISSIIVTLYIIQFVVTGSFKSCWYIASYVTGLYTTVSITFALKNMIAYPRPYFIDACNSTIVSCIQYTYMSVQDLECNNDVSVIYEALRSFPSGHTSISTFVVVWIYFKIKNNKYIASIIITTVYGPYLFIILSRFADHHHRIIDILGGIVIGWTTYMITSRFDNLLDKKN